MVTILVKKKFNVNNASVMHWFSNSWQKIESQSLSDLQSSPFSVLVLLLFTVEKFLVKTLNECDKCKEMFMFETNEKIEKK